MLKPALDVDESIREQIGRTPMFAEDGLDSIRKVVKDLQERLKVSPSLNYEVPNQPLTGRVRSKLPAQNGELLP